MHEQARKEAYRHLSAPLPIQSRQPQPTLSLTNFVETHPEEMYMSSKQNEELSSVKQRILSQKNIHLIGESLPELFSTPIYKSHEGLDVSNNQKFCSWATDQNYKVSTEHIQYDASNTLLTFESRFQSGNLGLVSSVEGDSQSYYLALQRDVNSKSGTTQWFYFKVNSRGNIGTFTFHIVNYVKPFSMFRIGMKPCIFSQSKNSKWQRGGSSIEYRKNSIPYVQSQNYYTLSFSYQFESDENQVYFAYCYPYTYTHLQNVLSNLQQKHFDKMRRKIIAKTLGGNFVELISITNPQILNKKILFITARTHPGETVSSFVCQAIIQFLLSNNIEAEKLRDQFIIKIVPMLNPDGVINGSYRCSLAGVDMNRQWRNPNKNTIPQIYNLKKIILQSQYKKLLFLDIHGHSKKKASFMYGCVSPKSPYVAKQLPYLLSRKMAHFNYFTCNFAVPRSKEGTARITLWKSGIDHSYTYQISFCGPQKQKRHFSINDFFRLGIQLCQMLSSYFYSRILHLQVDQELNRHCEQFYNDEQLYNAGNIQTNGSSSELQDETPQEEKIVNINKNFRKTVRSHNNTEKTESGRLNGLLQQYMLKRSKKIMIEEALQSQKQKNIDKQIYIKQRQSFMVTRVNLTQISGNQFYQNFSSYGLGNEKISHFDQSRSSSLRSSAQLALQQNSERQKGQSFGVLLPNVQKNQYKRYQRIDRTSNKRDKNLGERSISLYVQNIIQNQSNTSNCSKGPTYISKQREISLGERIRSRIGQKF